MRDALEAERFAREEALLRQREEFDGHRRTMQRQIADRDELLETQRSGRNNNNNNNAPSSFHSLVARQRPHQRGCTSRDLRA